MYKDAKQIMFYIVNLKTGSIWEDTCNSLLEANEFVSKHPEWTIMIKYNDRSRLRNKYGD